MLKTDTLQSGCEPANLQHSRWPPLITRECEIEYIKGRNGLENAIPVGNTDILDQT